MALYVWKIIEIETKRKISKFYIVPEGHKFLFQVLSCATKQNRGIANEIQKQLNVLLGESLKNS